MINTRKRFILISLFIFSSVAFASAVSDFSIAAGAIAGLTALTAIVGVSVGLPLVAPAALVVGLAMELANYSFFAKNNQAFSNVMPEIKKALIPMTADENSQYENQLAAEEVGGSQPVQSQFTATIDSFSFNGVTAADACNVAVNDWIVRAGAVGIYFPAGVDSAGSHCGVRVGQGSVFYIGFVGLSTSGIVCPSGTSIDANGLCQITLNPSAPRYVRTPAGLIMPNPANYPNYGSGYTDLSSGNVIEVLAPDGSRVKVDAAASTLGDIYPPVEITITGSSDAGGSSATSTSKLIEHVFSDGSVAESVVIPEFQIVDSQGNPSSVSVVATQPLDKLGSPVGRPIVQYMGQPLAEGTSVPMGVETICPAGTTLNFGSSDISMGK